jgi:protein ImuB
VDLPALPLQALLRAHPEWRELPVAALGRPGMQGEVVACNAHARRRGVTVGMRQAAALAMAPTLRAEAVEAADLRAVGEELLALMLRRAPRVEPGADGVFWIDPEGLTRLFGDLERWGRGLLDSLQAAGFAAAVVVGFHRHRAHALARIGRGVQVLADEAEEAALAGRVPLARLDLPAGLLESMAQLGVHHLGGFLTLPAAELRARFGATAAELHARYSETAAPLRPVLPPEPIVEAIEFDPPDDNSERLLFALQPLLAALLSRVAAAGDGLVMLQIALELDHAPPLHTAIEPAGALGDDAASRRQLADLLRLRLSGLELAAPVIRAALTAAGGRASAEQLALLRGRGRDLHAAGQALARIRAAFGETSVTRARLRPAHLPEAGFQWEPVRTPSCPKVQALPANDHAGRAAPPLVRRLLAKPRPLPAWSGRDEGGWLEGTGLVRGTVVRMNGPFRISGGWWARTVERDYYFAETSLGDIAWVYHDRPRQRWFLHAVLD